MSQRATVHMCLANTHVTPREQSTDRAYQNCFWPLARQKLWKDTMTCSPIAHGLRWEEVATETTTSGYVCAYRYIALFDMLKRHT